MATSLNVGVLIVPPVQLLDLSSVDLFGMLIPEYLEACGLPKNLTNLAIPVSIHYITESGPGTSASLTSSASLAVTDSLSSADVQPGKLDVLLIPGPDPNLVPSKEVVSFIHSHETDGKTEFLVICTGSVVAGHAGLLNGKRVSGPRGLIDKLKKDFPKANFVDKRWERDGRVWTSGGITNGHDLTAAYLHYKVQTELADLVCAMADVGDRGQEYDSGKATNTLWWLWLILRSAMKGGKSRGVNPSSKKD